MKTFKSLFFTILLVGTGFFVNSQTVHQVCISEVNSTGACNNPNGVFDPPNLTIQQGDQIEFTTYLVAITGYNGTHDIQFDGSPANNVTLPISISVLNPTTTVTTPPFNTPGTFPMECHNSSHCFNFAQTLEGWSCSGYSVTVQPNCSIDADFSASSLSICEGESISFTNSSSNFATSEWKINEAQEGTNTDFTHTFSDSGTFNVELIVEDGACKDSLSLAVEVAPVPDVSIQVTPTTTTINTPVSIDVSLSDTLPGSTYTWDFCNTDTDDSSEDFTYAWDTPGTNYCVCVTVDNNNSCNTAQSCVDPIVINDSDVSSIKELSKVDGLVLYPNPSDGNFTIRAETDIKNLEIIDIQGKIVLAVPSIPSKQKIKVDALPKGTYQLLYNIETNPFTKQIIVQ